MDIEYNYMRDVSRLFVRLDDTIEKVISVIQDGSVGLALVIDNQGCLPTFR